MGLILGIDSGTQSTRVLFYDVDQKRTAAFASAPCGMIVQEGGVREQNPGWWIEALESCLAQVSPQIRKQVEAVGVSGQQHGFVPVDLRGQPLHRAKLWCDTSTTRECEELTRRFGGEKNLLLKVGNPILPGYTASKILWFKTKHRESYEKTRWIFLPHDYLNYWLTGEAGMEYGDASGTGLLNIPRRCWQEDLLALVGPELGEKLPPLRPPAALAGRISPAAAARTGLPEGIPVSTGGGDNMMGAIGTGIVKEGVLAFSMGTSGTLYGCSSRAFVDPQGILASFCSSTGGWLPLACTMNCTVATEQTRHLFGLTPRELDQAAARGPAGAEGVVMLPFFNGERMPSLPRGKAGILGLDNGNFTRENLARASLESAIYGIKQGLRRFQELEFPVKEIRLLGGGAQSPVWQQMTADILGFPLHIPLQKEAAALGAALQAYWMREGGGQGELEKIVGDHVVLDSCKIIPDPSVQKAYEKGFSQYQSYLEALKPLYQ